MERRSFIQLIGATAASMLTEGQIAAAAESLPTGVAAHWTRPGSGADVAFDAVGRAIAVGQKALILPKGVAARQKGKSSFWNIPFEVGEIHWPENWEGADEDVPAKLWIKFPSHGSSKMSRTTYVPALGVIALPPETIFPNAPRRGTEGA